MIFSLNAHERFDIKPLKTRKMAGIGMSRKRQLDKVKFLKILEKLDKPINDNKQLLLNLPGLIRLRSSVCVQFKENMNKRIPSLN